MGAPVDSLQLCLASKMGMEPAHHAGKFHPVHSVLEYACPEDWAAAEPTMKADADAGLLLVAVHQCVCGVPLEHLPLHGCRRTAHH